MFRFNRKTSFASYCMSNNILVNTDAIQNGAKKKRKSTVLEKGNGKERKLTALEEMRLFQQQRWEQVKLKEEEEKRKKEEEERQQALAQAEEERQQALIRQEEARKQARARQEAKDTIVARLHHISTSIAGTRPLWSMEGDVRNGDNLSNSFVTIGEFADTLSRREPEVIDDTIGRISDEVDAWKQNGGVAPTLIM